MGLFSRRQEARQVRREPILAAPAPEVRSAARFSDGWGAVASGAAGGGGHYADNLSAILAVVELISATVASLPASIVVDSPAGRIPAPPGTPGNRILAQPNGLHSWPEWVQFTVASMLTHGNALSYVGTDGRGAPATLTPCPWPWVSPLIIPGAGGPRLVFDVLHSTPEARLLGLPGRILDSEAAHFRSRADNGVIGRSVISRAAAVCREGTLLGDAASAIWRHGMRPSAVMTSPTVLTEKNRAEARLMLDRLTGAMNAGRVPLMEGGFTFQQVGMSSVDQEFLATRRLNVEEIARVFRCPVGLIQPGAGVQPYEAMVAAFGQLCLAPLVAVLEAEFSAAVLPFGQYLQLDLSGMLRGSYSGMMGANSVAVQAGILTPNDARRAAGLPALPDGDTLRVGAAPSFPADAAGVPSLAPKPGPGAGALGNPGTNENGGSGG